MATEYVRPTDYGTVPTDWSKKTIADVCKLVTDGTHNPPSRVENGIPLLSSQNIKDGEIDFDKRPSYISENDFRDLDRSFSIEISDILLTVVGTLGRSVLVDGEQSDKPFTIQRSVAMLRPDSDRIFPQFLYQLTKSNDFKRQVEVRSKATAQSGLYLEELRKIVVPLPGYEEQRRIADILSTVDELIQQTDDIIEETKELKRGLMQDLYTSGTERGRETRATRIGELPTEWELTTIDQYAKVISGTHVKSDLVSDDESLTPYITGPSDFTRLGVHVSKYTDSPSSFCKVGDTLVTVKGMSCGKSTFADSSVSISRQIKAIRPGGDLDEKYLFYWVRYKEQLLYTLAEGTRQLGLSTSDLTSLPIPIPPSDEQEQIGDLLSNIDVKISQEMESKQRLQELKRGLMQDLLTGKVRVNPDN